MDSPEGWNADSDERLALTDHVGARWARELRGVLPLPGGLVMTRKSDKCADACG